jgi:hypothetical protein
MHDYHVRRAVLACALLKRAAKSVGGRWQYFALVFTSVFLKHGNI